MPHSLIVIYIPSDIFAHYNFNRVCLFKMPPLLYPAYMNMLLYIASFRFMSLHYSFLNIPNTFPYLISITKYYAPIQLLEVDCVMVKLHCLLIHSIYKQWYHHHHCVHYIMIYDLFKEYLITLMINNCIEKQHGQDLSLEHFGGSKKSLWCAVKNTLFTWTWRSSWGGARPGCWAVHHPGRWSHRSAACSIPRRYG